MRRDGLRCASLIAPAAAGVYVAIGLCLDRMHLPAHVHVVAWVWGLAWAVATAAATLGSWLGVRCLLLLIPRCRLVLSMSAGFVLGLLIIIAATELLRLASASWIVLGKVQSTAMCGYLWGFVIWLFDERVNRRIAAVIGESG